MIKYVTGDLLDASEHIIVHQVNCQGKMGSGIALQIKNKYPKAFDDYYRYVNHMHGKNILGNVYMSTIEPHKKYIANLFGQDKYGYDGQRYTNYEALYNGLEYIRNTAQKGKKSVAIPYKIGSDRGGADWEIVLKMIERLFDDYEVTIYKLQ